jgi:hypothetical protein
MGIKQNQNRRCGYKKVCDWLQNGSVEVKERSCGLQGVVTMVRGSFPFPYIVVSMRNSNRSMNSNY